MVEDLRIVLLGKTGSGKSLTGNTILGRNEFKVDSFSESTTDQCEKHTITLNDQNISIIDTPGLFHTSMTEEELKSEIEKCLKISIPGPHVFLLVIRLDMRFTEEEMNTVKWIQKNFGEDVMRFTLVLFTGADEVNKPIEEFVQENIKLKEVLNECEAGYHTFTNVKKNDGAQVSELMKNMKTIVTKNKGEHYTEEMYLDAQRKIREENERKKQEEAKKKEEKISHDKNMQFILLGGGIAIVLSLFLYHFSPNVLHCH